MAGPTLTARIALTGDTEIKAQLAALGVAGEAAFKALQVAADTSSTGFGARFSAAIAATRAAITETIAVGAELGRGFAEAGKAVSEIGTVFVEMGKKAAEAALVIGGLEFGLGKLEKSAAENAESIKNNAAAFGLTTQKYQELTFAAGKVGVEQDKLNTAMIRLNTVFERMADTTGQATGKLNAHKMSAKDVAVAMREAADASQGFITRYTELGSIDAKGQPLIGVSKYFKDLGTTVQEGSKYLDQFSKAEQEIIKVDLAAGSKTAGASPLGALGDTHTIDQAIAALKNLGFVVKGNVNDNLIELSRVLGGVTDAEKRLEIESALMPRSMALALDPFLRQGPEAIKTAEQLADTLKIVMSEAEIEVGEQAAQSFNVLDASLIAVKNHIGLALAPAFAQFAAGVSQFLAQNSEALKAWATDLATKALPLVKDFFNAISGNDAAVQNQGFLKFRDQIVQFGTEVKNVFTGIVIPAFQDLLALAGHLATGVNNIFGTQFTGPALLAVGAALQFLGVFKLIAPVWSLLIALGTNLWNVINFMALAARILSAAFLLALGSPAVAAIAAVVAGLVYLATRQSEATKAANFHATSIRELNQAFAEYRAGVLDDAGLKKEQQDHLDAAQAALTHAEAVLKALQAVTEYNVSQLGGFEGGGLAGAAPVPAADQERILALTRQNRLVADQIAAVAALKATVVDTQATVDRQNKQIASGFQEAGQAATAAGEQAVQSYALTDGSIVTVTRAMKAGQVATDQASASVRTLGDAAKPAAGQVKSVGDAVKQIGGQASQIQRTFTDLATSIAGTIENIFSTLARQVAIAASEVQNSVGPIIAALQNALAAAQALASTVASIGGGFVAASGSASAPGLAGGGHVRGPGSGTSDSIPAWLSNNEFVMSSAATSHWGVGLMSAINEMRGFSLGGLVADLGASFAVPRFSGGGPVIPAMAHGPSGTPVHLHFGGGRSVQLAGSSGAVGQLVRYANRSQMLSLTSRPPVLRGR